MKQSEAKSLGLTQYETDRPCPKCGSTIRRSCNGACYGCHNQSIKSSEKAGGSRYLAKLDRNKKAKATRKAKVFDHYGRSCSICGFSDMRALTIDHMGQDGSDHKTPSGKRIRGFLLYRWLIRHGFPKGFRTLCCNCQSIIYAEHEGRDENNAGGIRERVYREKKS